MVPSEDSTGRGNRAQQSTLGSYFSSTSVKSKSNSMCSLSSTAKQPVRGSGSGSGSGSQSKSAATAAASSSSSSSSFVWSSTDRVDAEEHEGGRGNKGVGSVLGESTGEEAASPSVMKTLLQALLK